jgi:small subunit ribosomal protein S17
VVTVERVRQHSLYGKVMRRSRNYVVHNEGNVARQGDQVRIVESRPLSATKRWTVEEILKKAEE